MKFLLKTKRIFYNIIHYFGCPRKDLTRKDEVRVCRKCSRLRFESKEVEQVFKQIGYHRKQQ